jgi:hypothetical protein
MKSTAESSVFEKHSILGLYLLAGLVFLILFASTTITYAYDVTLAWDPKAEPDLAGYILYRRENDPESNLHQVDYYSLDEMDPNNPQGAV